MRQQEKQSKITEIDPTLLEKALWEELNFTNGISSEVVVTILDHIVVLEGSDDKQIYLEIYLRLGQSASVHFNRDGLVFCNIPSFENGDKKRPSTFRTLRPANGQFYGIQFFKLAGGERFVKTVCGRQVHRG